MKILSFFKNVLIAALMAATFQSASASANELRWSVAGDTASFKVSLGTGYATLSNKVQTVSCSITSRGEGSVKVVFDRKNSAPGIMYTAVPSIHVELEYAVYNPPVMIETRGLFQPVSTLKPKIAMANGSASEIKVDEFGNQSEKKVTAPTSYMGMEKLWFAPKVEGDQDPLMIGYMEVDASYCLRATRIIPPISSAMQNIITVGRTLGW